MITVTARELTDDPAQVLRRVQYGNERVAITRRGKPVAALVPMEDARLLERLEDLTDAKHVLVAIEEAEEEGTIGWEALRLKLGPPR